MPRPQLPDPRRIGHDLADERFATHLTERVERLSPKLAELLDKVLRVIGPWTGLIITLFIGGLIVAAGLELFEDTWEWVRESTGTATIDQEIHAAAVEARTPALTAVLTVITELAGKVGMPIVGVVLAVALSWAARSWRPLLLTAIAGLGSLLLTLVSKNAAGRDRPPHADALPPFETSPSFPSGHTLNATAILLVVAYCAVLQFDRTVTKVLAVAGLLAFVVLVGVSRIYLGHHWFSDVGAALALGVAWAAVVMLGHQVFSVVRSRRRELAAENGAEER
ncbi:MAG: phosphatase PAP2 family protein [Microbacteriaceae bacterium]|nr:phosphatase PAP2 family protein [Microbacteriaceae bacterium]